MYNNPYPGFGLKIIKSYDNYGKDYNYKVADEHRDFNTNLIICPKECGYRFSDGSEVCKHYYDEESQRHIVILKEKDGRYTYLCKDKNFDLIDKSEDILTLDQAILIATSYYVNKVRYRARENTKRQAEREVLVERERIAKLSFKKKLEEEISCWCKDIIYDTN